MTSSAFCSEPESFPLLLLMVLEDLRTRTYFCFVFFSVWVLFFFCSTLDFFFTTSWKLDLVGTVSQEMAQVVQLKPRTDFHQPLEVFLHIYVTQNQGPNMGTI